MKRILFVLFAVLFAPLAWGACVTTGQSQIVDQSEPACFPLLDKDKCPHYLWGEGRGAGSAKIDVEDAKRIGKQIMNYANARACEGKPNCGPYVMEFKSTATCDGNAVEDMPGGEYRGLTAQKARQIQAFSNRKLEELSGLGEDRGKKPNAKHKGKLWGNE